MNMIVDALITDVLTGDGDSISRIGSGSSTLRAPNFSCLLFANVMLTEPGDAARSLYVHPIRKELFRALRSVVVLPNIVALLLLWMGFSITINGLAVTFCSISLVVDAGSTDSHGSDVNVFVMVAVLGVFP